jgi:ATP-dependent DNA helicase PIF1
MQFKCLQFSIRLTFAMTINKSQGQTMSVCGLDLNKSCFSHGRYTKRALEPFSLFELAKDGIAKNIVHSVALKNLYCFLLTMS